ncbi:hypothetical protein SAQ01S_07500 [Sphingomonas aquatilis NBRC 16722]|uniref:Uncharacterized protein n=1 Tax=Sphingomonas aquatilis TaxID=93063 RepID=A0AAW3TR24_9SPHN|nr:hypothetical protein [Sphingomonas aquatilis]MBB3876133.1 hypothetical protein [Sphingomonas aquatilis]GEM70984.1 hypothetical protein SAQ01S_07500 [Sphingomonas aquatilis NBRC 16722]
MPANQSTPEVTFDIRRNPESIWLSPICDDTADHGDGRTWASPAPEEVCEDPECGEPWVRYVREDLASPARGGDELRATAQFLSDRLDDLEWMDGDLESTLRDFMGHVDPAHARLKSALASTDMAGAGDVDAAIAVVRAHATRIGVPSITIAADHLASVGKPIVNAGQGEPCDFYLGDCVRCGKRADRDNQLEPCARPRRSAPQVEGLTSERRDDYRGWQIEHNPPPIPTRAFDWTATHPSFDGEGDTRQVWGATWDAVRAEIDTWHEENAA